MRLDELGNFARQSKGRPPCVFYVRSAFQSNAERNRVNPIVRSPSLLFSFFLSSRAGNAVASEFCAVVPLARWRSQPATCLFLVRYINILRRRRMERRGPSVLSIFFPSPPGRACARGLIAPPLNSGCDRHWEMCLLQRGRRGSFGTGRQNRVRLSACFIEEAGDDGEMVVKRFRIHVRDVRRSDSVAKPFKGVPEGKTSARPVFRQSE